MAISELYSGSETVSTSEWSLTTDTAGPDADTTDGIFQAFIDLNALVAGDVFTIKVYEKCQSGATQRAVQTWTVTGAQADPLWVSPSLILMHGWDFTIIRTAGADRLVIWSVRSVA